MKKLLYSALCFLLAGTSLAQTVSISLTTAPCHDDGVLTANLTGFTPPVTVTWTTYGMAGTSVSHTASGTSDVLLLYSGGPVYVYATDGTASSGSYYAGMPPFTYSVTTTVASCPTPGTATAFVVGGTSPYTYQWFDASTLATVSTSNPASLPGGTYGLTISDAAGCSYGSLHYTDSVGIYDTGYLDVFTASTTANCTNGTATVTGVSGGTGPYTYLWTTGATSASITGLTMGYYYVTVTDALGCTGTGYPYVPQAITINVPTTPTPATCLATDGVVICFPAGGMPPYTYIWSNGATTQSQTGISSGYYGVSVTDANGCIGEGNAYISASTPITVSYSSTASSCTSPTGTASIVPVGGTAPYSITWYTTPIQTTATATGLGAGTYNFRVVDAVGCVRTGAVVVQPIHIINATFANAAATCALANGSSAVTASGGTAPYTYLWSTGSTSTSITSVVAGNYAVTITDAAGCSAYRCTTVPVYSPMTVGVSSTPASCIFTNDGSLTAVPVGGTAPYTYSWTGGGTTSTISGLATGKYWLTVNDALGCTKTLYNYVGYNASATSCYCTISGTVYVDANGNCTQDVGEAGIPHVQIACTGRGYTYTNSLGQYSFLVPSGTYTVTETVQTFYPLSPCQPNNIVVTASAASGCVLPVNFANNMTPIHDMKIRTWNYSLAVPGNPYDQVVTVTNMGTMTESTSLGGYKTDGQLFAPTFVPSSVFTGSTYWYSTATGTGLATLAPGASQTFHANYSVPTSVPLGTNLVFNDSVVWQAPISTWTSDYTPWNNVNYFNTTVVSSYDPNFKEVTPRGTGPTGIITAADTILEYMVHFQNLGTYKANDVVVLDTLDNDLDWTTLRPVYMSHKCKVTLTQVGSYKIAKFSFDNIDLPAKQDDDLRSNGMFAYTIRTMPGSAVGTQFTNSASIYFDYNAPVMTNKTVNTLGSVTVVEDVNAQQLKNGSFLVYPNPATQSFNVLLNSDVDGIADIRVCDITGKALVSKTIDIYKGRQTVNTDASQFAPGLYIVTVSQNGAVQTQKLTIVK